MSTESAVRPRAQHLGPQRRRPQVLDAALAIAIEQGVAAVTIAAVAERMKVTRPVVYACFPDRVALIEELIRREEGYVADGVFDALRERDVDAGEPVFVEGFRALLEVVAARPESWLLLYGNPDPAVAGSFGRGRALVVQRCTRLLRPTLRAWGIEDADRKLPVLVEQWISAGEGAVRTLLADDGHWTPEELGAFVGAAVYRALRNA
ncbi:TetR/AcrR family transcriptional regulator [Nocardia cyriacigeorgica]|uniref:TetR/AcrR family transcriptional regulator n=1 Tax=Nocardia cyriacigeorgica TaxID=135487 RepID=UPI0018959A77|nr:TetR/AcrR family transcriptional regulator [Nocardia cyriacigeorgica]MBF6159618.1 TetR/AcrR family transcriptional regulator [Nocardia cyriacigeorgica]MBF6198701.1 TetR/AcrR family transcriptional regulator [Nocardia cyriacigeorgica]MBF6394606.1 TetR/AcrR family transcriptional regulator [Nocardia cyriacigeorgica]MBF6400241.1 TetR/AcrR family transcriptional regulator [Nocardia cyriacigeorgica]MBF6515155.1 TetR/AcrR family transcriptional regulator [Nocardia cyriacigeorgica]